jgi:O-antigen/teichoic acid export membrane protein
VSKSAVILRNVASNWVGFAVNAAVTLVLTPFVLQALGTSRYGIWILTSSIIGYYGFLDLGFRAGVTQYLTRYLAVGDRGKASECMSTAVAVLGSLGVVMVALSVAAAYAAPSIFNLPSRMEREAFWCILIVGCSSALQFALCPFTSIFTATQRFDLANAIGVTTRLLIAGSVVAALKMQLGLVGVSAATCLVSAFDYVVRWRVATRLAPELEMSPRYASWRTVREIGAFGAWNSLISFNTFVYQHVPNILIGALMPIAAVGHYALATGLIRQIIAVLNPVGQVVYPAAAALHARGDRNALERLYHDGSRLMLLATVSVVVPAAFWAEDFYRLWIGDEYLSGSTFHSVVLLFQILLVSIGTTYFSSIGGQILIGSGYVRAVATALICGSVLNLGMSLILMGRFGLAGMAFATVFGSVVVDLVVMPLILQRALGLSVARFVRRACPRPLAAGAALTLAIVCLRLIGQPDRWPQFGLYALITASAGIAAVLAFGVTAAERQRYLVVPIRSRVRRHREPAEAIGSSS